MAQRSNEHRHGRCAYAALALLVLGIGGCVGPGLEPPGDGAKGASNGAPAADMSGSGSEATGSAGGAAGTGASGAAGTGNGAGTGGLGSADAGSANSSPDDGGMPDDAAVADGSVEL